MVQQCRVARSDEPQAASRRRIRVPADVQQAKLIERRPAIYLPLAKQARIQGLVRFNVIIGTDGRVEDITLISGHPLLVSAAIEALKQ